MAGIRGKSKACNTCRLRKIRVRQHGLILPLSIRISNLGSSAILNDRNVHNVLSLDLSALDMIASSGSFHAMARQARPITPRTQHLVLRPTARASKLKEMAPILCLRQEVTTSLRHNTALSHKDLCSPKILSRILNIASSY
jgi:hypothetical protein